MTEDKLSECRIFHLAAEAILPLIESLHTTAFERMLSHFRDGNTDLIAHVAKVDALHTLKEEIVTKAKLYEKSVEKFNQQQRGE